jgi:hypothetical protein
VGRLSRRGSGTWLTRLERIESIEVVALLRRRRADGDPSYGEHLRAETWEVPLVEIRTSV